MNKSADVPHHGPWHGRIEDDPLVRGRGRYSDDVRPDISVDHHTTPCRTNPLGVKGTGEAGTTAAPPVIINAILDALPKDARGKLEMPATAERVWRALQPAG